MTDIPLLFFFAGAALLIFGYKKDNRALLTISAFLWLASGTWSDFARGFSDGAHSTNSPVTSYTAH
jgi:hypothetical protein